MFKLLKTIFEAGEPTVRYPFAPLPISPGFRGKPEFTAEQCIACAACTVACPANALTMQTDAEAGTRKWSLFLGRCIFCGRCEEVCPTKAIVLSEEFELAVANKKDLFQEATFKLTKCRQCEQPFAPAKEVNYVIALLTQSGVPAEQAEAQRVHLETCPDCKRKQSIPRPDNVSLGQHMPLGMQK
jgi:hydrogenase-4 component H